MASRERIRAASLDNDFRVFERSVTLFERRLTLVRLFLLIFAPRKTTTRNEAETTLSKPCSSCRGDEGECQHPLCQ